MTRKIIITVVVILILAVGGFFGYRYMTARAATSSVSNLQTTPVTRGTITQTVSAAGTVRADQSTTLAWQTSGIVDKVEVKVGDKVQANQELANIRQDSLAQSLIMAQVSLQNDQKALDDLLNSKTPAAQAQQAVENAQNALSDYSANFPLKQAQAQAAVVTAQDALTKAQRTRNNLNYARATQGQIDAAAASYNLAVSNVGVAQKAYDQESKLPDTDPRKNAALINLSNAEKKRDAALANLNWYLGKPSAADIADADAAMAQAQANLATTQQSYDRIKNGPNPVDIALLQAQLDDAIRAYNDIKDGPAPSDIAAAKARIAGDQALLNEVKITAPFTGTITDVSVLPGDQASSNKVVFSLNNMDHLMVDLSISEVDIANIQVGQSASITFDAIPGKEYQGKVSEVGVVGASTQGVVNFPVTVQITSPDQNIKLGMTAAVNIVTNRKANVLMVPNRAIRVAANQRSVTMLFEGNQLNVPITVGLTNDTVSEVTGGNLKEGDEVVISGAATTTNSGGFGGGGMFGGFGR
jgi:HlyD family secretion protein